MSPSAAAEVVAVQDLHRLGRSHHYRHPERSIEMRLLSLDSDKEN